MEKKRMQNQQQLTLDQFHELLINHKWSFQTDSFAEFVKAQRAERDFFDIAMRGGVDYIRAISNVQIAPIKQMESASYQEAMAKAEKSYAEKAATGDEEFDAYRERLNYHDWHFDYSDDIKVWRRGNEAHKALMDIAKEKGGIYIACWNHRVKKAYGDGTKQVL